MELVTGCAQKLLDYTVNPVWRQFRYLLCYHNNIEGLMKQVEELKDEHTTVQHLIDEATRNGEKIEDKVQHWMSRVDEITGQTQQFCEEESQAKTSCRKTLCPNLWLRYQLSKKAKKLALEVAEILGKRHFDRVSYRDYPQWMLDSTNEKSNEAFESRVLIMNRIMEALQDPSVTMVGLCGLGGVGKTTIAKEVAVKVKDERMFENVIMAIVSDDVNLEKVQGQIAEMLGMKLDEKTESIRASRLCERLKQEKNLLIILDDLWEKLDLGKVGMSFIDDGKYNKNNKGCKILLTSRNEKLLSDQMKCERNIKVGLLSDKEAWELFKRIAELSIDSISPDFISVAIEIVQKCEGLPLAIVAAAGALRKKDLTEWKDTLRRLKNPLRRNFTGFREVDSILKLSYDYLSPEYKPIFLLSAMMSHDPLIRDLLMYSIGLDLLKRVENMEEAQDGIFALVCKLKASNLLLDSFSSDHFTMHDVVREVALSIQSNENHVFIVRHGRLNQWPDEDSLQGYTGICLEKIDISDFPEELHGPRLEFFLLSSTDLDLTIPGMFFKSTKELKVLSFIDIHLSSLPSLSFLQKLRTLCLHSCLLKDITEVGNLKNLKILSLAYSEIEELPFELAQLTFLQVLNLAHCYELKKIPPKLLSSLKRLEVLYMENSFNQWEAEGSHEGNENASLSELKNLSISSLDIHIPDASILPKDLFLDNVLERYRILIGELWKWSSKNETSTTLKLELKSIHLDFGILKLFERVEDLYLVGFNEHANVLYNMDGRRFSHLKHLQIENNHDMEYVVSNSTYLEVVFPILQTLKLKNLKGLKKLSQGPIAATFFQNLKVIKVRSCHQLKSIFSILMIGSFCNLVEIEIVKCFSMIEIVTTAIEDSFGELNSATDVIVFHQLHSLKLNDLTALIEFCIEDRATSNRCKRNFKSVFSNKVLFPKLEVLQISNLNRLISSIWPNDRLSQGSFSNLKTLIVEGCGFVRLVPFHVLESLNNLKELEVRKCDMLEMVFDLEELDYYKEIQSLVVVPLKKLRLFGLPKLKNVWSNDPQGIVSFQSLHEVNAHECESLTSMFPASVAKDICHLEELSIYSCGMDVIVAQDQASESVGTTFVFPRLTSLQLSKLPNLRNFYPQRHISQWPHLQQLSIGGCDELKIFENEASSSSAIYQEECTLDSRYPLLSHEEVIPNLEKLRSWGKEAEMIWNGQFPSYLFRKVKELDLDLNKESTFSYGLLKRFPKLEVLWLQGGETEVIFSGKEPLRDDDDAAARVAPFRKLHLFSTGKAKHIWNQHSPEQLLQRLQDLHVIFCDDLISLGPSFISLANLTALHVQGCRHLTTLLTSSTARSLANLERLLILGCHSIEEIIKKQHGEDDEDKDIVFNKLWYLELEELLSLNHFCCYDYTFMFPSLDEVVVKECPRLTMFCRGDVHAPLLKDVDIGGDKKFWAHNLNTTIQKVFAWKEILPMMIRMERIQFNITLGENSYDNFSAEEDNFVMGDDMNM